MTTRIQSTMARNRVRLAQDARSAKPRAHPEDDEQRALIQWRDLHKAKYPELGLLFHIPNGGKRDAREAARLKAQGVLAGVSDLLLPVVGKDPGTARRSGLWLEMKSAKGRLTLEQVGWMNAMEDQRFRCRVCHSWQDAAREIIAYLGLPLEVK